MKKIALLVAVLFTALSFAQQSPMVVVDAKKLGYLKEVEKEVFAIKSDDIATMSVFKDSEIAKSYGSEHGVIVITTKNYIVETFYKNHIKDSPLQANIASAQDLVKIGILSAAGKNQPYDELAKYIFTNTANEKILKIAAIGYIKPEDAVKINPDWKYGALDISAAQE